MAVTVRRSSTRSGLFLTELIIAILFFSLASAICTQLFVKAYTVSNKSRDLNIAMNQIQSAAESFKASDGSLDGVLKLVGGNFENANEASLLFDSEWQKTDTNPAYRLSITLDQQNPVTATIAAYKLPKKSVDDNTVTTENKGELIHIIQTKKYVFDK